MSFLSNKIVLSGVGVLALLFSMAWLFGGSVPEEDITSTSQQKTGTPAVISETTSSASVAEAVKENLPTEEPSVPEDTKTPEAVSSRPVEQETTAQTPAGEFYSVVKVVDGDTLAIEMNGQIQTIRLIGIDTPETVHPSKPVECFGVEASSYAKAVLTGAQVSIETDETQDTYDKYDRLLAYVILEDGTNFNKLMIEEGYGYEYTYSLPYKYQNEFKSAQQQAEANKRGLWADGVCEEETAIVPLEEPQSTPSPDESAPNYICSYNAYNCTDFSTHNEAQTVYELCGGVANDIHRLDRDKDGLACESLP
ncbi:thermonuclease family protein [Patescibacteria group bacterium]|nr:thermonuclease family protein [Patescibacteria group bacterium]